MGDAIALVIPDREQTAIAGDREVRLPLVAGSVLVLVLVFNWKGGLKVTPLSVERM